MVTSSQSRVDVWMLVSPVCLVVIGLVLLYSASYPQATGTTLLTSAPVRQGAYALLGFALLFLVARLDYRLLANVAFLLYSMILLLLVVVLFIGEPGGGIQRWIDLKFFLLQPSEFAKPFVAIALAKFFSQFKEEIQGLRTLAGSLAIVGVPMGLVYLQPDLGTAMVFTSMWLGMAIMGGIRPLYLGVLAVLGALSTPIVYLFLLKPYMQQRLLLFMDPYGDPLGAGYNVLQSEISVGSGGLFGKGLLNGTQSQLHFLRVQQTDFIFSVLGEELGFIGGVILIGLFATLAVRGFKIAERASDNFGKNLAVGITSLLTIQAIVNLSSMVALLPLTGVPLPFISYGGSALVANLTAIGILLNISRRSS